MNYQPLKAIQFSFALSFLCFLHFFSIGQDMHESNFFRLWKKVYNYELTGLPKSASSVVDSIYKISNQKGDHQEKIKAIIYQSKFILLLDENGEDRLFQKLKHEISISMNELEKALLHSYLASAYDAYKDKNQWKIRKRTDTEESSGDYKTWSIKRLHKEIEKHHLASIKNRTVLQKFDISEISDLITNEVNSDLLRPTVFDFLANRTIEFYSKYNYHLPSEFKDFAITSSSSFQNSVKEFGKSHSETYLYKAFVLIEDLKQFHLEKDHIAPYIDLAIQWLQLVKKNASFESADELFLSELEKLQVRFKDSQYSTLIDYEIVKVYFDQGTNFPTDKTEKQKLVQAREVCLNAESRYPKSIGVQKCAGILNQIDALSLNIQTEEYNPSETYSKLLVNYKNIDSISVKVYKVNRDFATSYRGISDQNITNLFKKDKTISDEKYLLINDFDFQTHSTEVPLPKLGTGSYFITVSSMGDSSRMIHAYGVTQITNIALVSTTRTKYQLIDRTNGAPLAGAAIRIYSDNDMNVFEYQLTSDQQGFFNIKPLKNRNYFEAIVDYNGDHAEFDNIYVYQNWRNNDSEEEEELIVKPAFFTDRSIYRPGQTVYFKGILTKQKGTSKALVKNELVEVYMEDDNGTEIGEYLTLRTNDFGSFSGEFKLPKTGLTGEYTIYVEEGTDEDSQLYDDEMDDFDYIEHIISVEEYKRPRFSVKTDPVDTTYSLGDSILISGKAMAFSGTAVSNAEIKYKVSRGVQYPSWYYWNFGYGYGNANVDIASGTALSNDDGSFEVDFVALADSTVEKKNQPVFTYHIEIDVTDINGETRSAQSQIKIGYHSYQLDIHSPEKIDIEEESKLKFSSTNLNGVKVPAQVEVEIYKEKFPAKVLRNRPWSIPDRPILSEENFNEMFPNELYRSVYQGDNGETVFKKTIDTSIADSLILKSIQNWQQGKYIVTAKINDPSGIEIKSKKKLEVYSSKKTIVSDYQKFSIQKDRQIYKPGNKINLNVGSAAPNLNVTFYLYADNKLLKTKVLPLHNEVKTIDFLIPKTEVKSLKIYYSYSYANSYESGNIDIPIAKKNEGLDIRTETFRDKLVPGTDETWSFIISDQKGKKVSAELLASMYDQSLDEFKSHKWTFINFDEDDYHYYNSSPNFNSHYSFGTTYFKINNRFDHLRPTYSQRYSRFEFFGFNMRNPKRSQTRYLESIKIYKEKESHLSLEFDEEIKKGTIMGKIVDDGGYGIPGVTIIKQGTTIGAITDMEGDFSLDATNGDILTVSFIGYTTQEIPIGKYNRIQVQLIESVEHLEEVVVTGYATQKKQSLTGSIVEVTEETVIEDIVFSEAPEEEFDQVLQGTVAGVQITKDNSVVIRGNTSWNPQNSASDLLYVVDGIIVNSADLNKNDIIDMQILKGEAATAIYGARAAGGVVIISTKSGQDKLAQEMASIKGRTNLKETAFFHPHITAEKKGLYKFTFTTPETLTQWKLQLFAHDSKLQYGLKIMQAVSQKELMVIPNPPRFLRQGDQITIQTKIANLTNQPMEGQVSLLLTDPVTNSSVDDLFDNNVRTLPFTITPNGNATASWDIHVSETVDLVQYKIVAKTDQFTDGESQVLPVLSNRQLITETMPVWANGDEKRDFELTALKSAGSSSTLRHHRLTFEMTENPVWYAIKSLPYLLEFPHECAEQTFSRYYANVLGSHILNSNPFIKSALDKWKTNEMDKNQFEKNEQLKSILIEETPWLRDAQSESEKQSRLATLMDLTRTEKESEQALNKLFGMKDRDGGYPWFAGGTTSRTITQHIVGGFGHLHALGLDIGGKWEKWTINSIISSVKYIDRELTIDYQKILDRSKNPIITRDSVKYLASPHLNFRQIQGLYARSYYDSISVSQNNRVSYEYFINQADKYWIEYSLYEQAMISIILSRNGRKIKAHEIITSIKENSTSSEEFGAYWKSNLSGWYWYQSPIETQALLIEAFQELIPEDQAFIEKMKVWLLRNKQTNSWPTTKSTTDAVYALLINQPDQLNETGKVEVRLGGKLISDAYENQPAGYYSVNWTADDIKSDLANVSINNTKPNTAWGALYWQYFEDLDQVKSSESSWSIEKHILLKTNSMNGIQLTQLSDSISLKVGDLVTIRLILKTDRDSEFVHLKDQRSAGLEPVDVLSEYKWQDGLGYFQSTRDTGTHFFFDSITKGTYVFEYDLRVNNSGEFSNGIATLQSMYAPEFSGHSNGTLLLVE